MILFRHDAHKAGRFVCQKVDDAVAMRAFRRGSYKLLLDARRLQLNGTGIRVTTVDPGLAETEFSVVRFKSGVARAKRFTKAPVLSPPKTLLQKNAPLHI